MQCKPKCRAGQPPKVQSGPVENTMNMCVLSDLFIVPCRYVRRPYRLRDKRHGQKALQDMMVLHEPLFGGLDMQRCRNISATPMLLYTFT
ncbi:hypothetical protein ABBQ32_011458 [Trebouxia sp. C0010 RCD-2024]